MNLRKQKLLLNYPVLTSRREMCYSALVISLLVYFFLAIFQPFGTYTFQHNYKYLLLLAYPLIAFSFFYIGDLIVYKFLSKCIWNWEKEIYKNILVLFACSLSSYLYLITIINHSAFSLIALMYMVLFTFVIGVPICAINLLAKFILLRNSEVDHTGDIPNSDILNGINVSFVISPDSGDQIRLTRKGFCYAQSEGNYSLLFYLVNGKIQRKLVRLSLKNLEDQIGHESIFRCHRSYIINSNLIEKKEGNSQGFKLSLNHIDGKIPVSRAYVDKIKNHTF